MICSVLRRVTRPDGRGTELPSLEVESQGRVRLLVVFPCGDPSKRGHSQLFSLKLTPELGRGSGICSRAPLSRLIPHTKPRAGLCAELCSAPMLMEITGLDETSCPASPGCGELSLIPSAWALGGNKLNELRSSNQTP